MPVQVRLLLDAAPEAALERRPNGATPLAAAATKGHAAVVQQLLAAAPSAAELPINLGLLLPIHMAVTFGHLAVLQHILEAAPQTATMRDGSGCTALHTAIQEPDLPDRAAIVRQIIAAAPETATASTED